MPDVQRDFPFWSVDPPSLLRDLKSSAQGLSSAEATERLKDANQLKAHRRSVWALLIDQFKSPIILLLFGSAVLSFSMPGEQTDGYIIVVILLVGGLLSFWQELSAADAVAKLLGMIQTRAMVVRDGKEQEVPLEEIVVGDIVRFRAGDVIPGDCRLLMTKDLFSNESALTGESFPAEKNSDILPQAAPLSQRTNSLFLGTHIISGLGTAVVVKTGRDTEFGKISERLEHKAPETGFERGLRQFGQLLLQIVAVITVVVFLIQTGLQHKPMVEAFQFTLALAVGMTPQLLPAITSVVLASGAKAMARKKVIVKQLLAIENLGSMSILCSDKTGTLTEGMIEVHGTLDIDGQHCDRVARLAYLNASLQTGFVNPIDRAICEKTLFDKSGVEKLDEIPYDFIRKRLSVRVADNGRKVLITKGALTQVLECCSHVAIADGQLVEIATRQDDIHKRFSELSNQGYRVLGLATREDDVAHITRDDERQMAFQGFLVFADPPKADAQATMAQLKELGVSLKIITGDNRAVAQTISRHVGIDNPNIVTGADVHHLTNEALWERSQSADVFAEVEPNQKERIILALKSRGAVVGYMGDGINDASALHAADVGISVASAVDVAREAAQVVLLEQDLGVLVQGVREGRRTFSNTLKYVFFAIAANFGYMFSLSVASVLLPFEPLLAAQILLVNLLADFPAMALATDTVDPEQIRRPRRWEIGVILRFMMSFGLASSLFDFMTFGAMLYFFGGQNLALFHTGWFIESVLSGLMILMVIRTRRPFFRSMPGGLFLLAEAVVAIITLILPVSPFANSLGFEAPPLSLLLIVLLIQVLYVIGMELTKVVFYRFNSE